MLGHHCPSELWKPFADGGNWKVDLESTCGATVSRLEYQLVDASGREDELVNASGREDELVDASGLEDELVDASGLADRLVEVTLPR